MEDENELARSALDAAMLAVETQFEKDEQGRWVHAPVGSEIDPNRLRGRTPDEP